MGRTFTIGTPIRNDYSLDISVREHINLWNEWDLVQVSGGPPSSLGRAGQLVYGAINQQVLNYILQGAINSHGDMHANISVWLRYIVPNLTLDWINVNASLDHTCDCEDTETTGKK